jgi:hypothetical protein
MTVEKENIKQLIRDIKKKKELREISDKFVKEQLDKLFTKDVKVDFNPRSAVYKTIIKDVRAKLRRVYGLFRTKENLAEIKKLLSEKKIDQILSVHSSTKERILFYPQLYQKIFQITGKPKTLLDLGCGINPFSFQHMKLSKLNYYAYDLSKEEISLINQYFKSINLDGKAEILNLLDFDKVKRLPSADLSFLFKMTDVLDRGKGHKTSEELIKSIPAKHVVISFATLTMSGKKMNHPRRGWIELMSKRLGYSYQLLEFSNELFYVISKDNN